jgi:hypothetical protein
MVLRRVTLMNKKTRPLVQSLQSLPILLLRQELLERLQQQLRVPSVVPVLQPEQVPHRLLRGQVRSSSAG